MQVLWPNQILYRNVLLLVTDGAAYMKKAGSALQTLYPNMLHVTCIAHALHRVAEDVRGSYREVDELIANVKKVYFIFNNCCFF